MANAASAQEWNDLKAAAEAAGFVISIEQFKPYENLDATEPILVLYRDGDEVMRNEFTGPIQHYIRGFVAGAHVEVQA